jgi:hypothetical protein
LSTRPKALLDARHLDQHGAAAIGIVSALQGHLEHVGQLAPLLRAAEVRLEDLGHPRALGRDRPAGARAPTRRAGVPGHALQDLAVALDRRGDVVELLLLDLGQPEGHAVEIAAVLADRLEHPQEVLAQVAPALVGTQQALEDRWPRAVGGGSMSSRFRRVLAARPRSPMISADRAATAPGASGMRSVGEAGAWRAPSSTSRSSSPGPPSA